MATPKRYFRVTIALLLSIFAISFLVVTSVAETIKVADDLDANSLKYLSDSDADSTRPELAPWAEIIEVWTEDDAIIIKSMDIMNYSVYSAGEGWGYIMFFFDEDFDNITDVAFRWSKFSVGGYEWYDYCHLYRYSNHTYYYDGSWNYAKGMFDPRTEENETLCQTTFHFGGALKGEMKLKVATHYVFDIARPGGVITKRYGGDTVPNCQFEIQEVVSPPSFETLSKAVDDTKFLYPNRTLVLGDARPPPPPAPLTIYDIFRIFFSSIQSWMSQNLLTFASLSILVFAAIYSVVSRIRTFLNVAAIYVIVAGLIYGVAILRMHSIFLPLLFSVGLLVPIFVWYRSIADTLSSKLEVLKKYVWIEVFALFLLGLAVRLPFLVFVFPIPLEKTPLVYLVVLTIVLVKGNRLDVYGFRKEKMVRSLLIGVVYYLMYGIPFFLTVFGLTYLFTGYLAFDYYHLPSALWIFPFMTLCVGVSEEGLFRGFIQTRLGQVYGKNKAILVQALLFGVWHFVHYVSSFNLVWMVERISQTFVLGLIWGLFYKKSGNLIPLILAHGITDTILVGVGSPWAIYTMETLFSSILRVSMVIGLTVQLFCTIFLAQKAIVKAQNGDDE